MTTPVDAAIRLQLEAQLRGTEFDFKPKNKIRRRLVVEVVAREKRGKTHLAISAPAPTAFCNFDIGDEGVVEKFPGKIIIPAKFGRVPPNTAPAQAMTIAQGIWDKFLKAYQTALANTIFRTIVIDTATELWDTLRMARFGKYEQVPQHLYGFANREFSDTIRQAYDHDKNLILLSKMGKEYKGGEKTGKITESFWTGRYERKGFTDLPYIVQVCCESDYDFATKEFVLTIVECRQRPSLSGEQLRNTDFTQLAMMVYPDSSPEDWE